jgi:MarR family 2-MHQ and catechol resistance regulon transcriptional repressor
MRREGKKVPLEVEVFDLLQQSAMITAREVYRFLSRYNLSVSQFRTLEVLYHQGPLCQRDISEHVVKTTGTMTTVIDGLERKFLVRRVRDKDDRRRYNIELTPQGEKLVQKILPQQTKLIKQVMGRLASNDLENLKRICRVSLCVGNHPIPDFHPIHCK